MKSLRGFSMGVGAVALILILVLGQIASASPIIVNYTSSGSWTAPAGVTSIKLLVVGGGGGGSSGGNAGRDSGGGAGGLLYNAAYAVVGGNTYTVTVGAGGPTGLGGARNGGISVFGSVTALGGGGGGYYNNNFWGTAAGQVGSGGGGGENSNGGYGTPGQGTDGSWGDGQAAGGGGAGSSYSRVYNVGNHSKVGGIGLDYSSIFGASVGAGGWFAGGGSEIGTASVNLGGGGKGGAAGVAGSGGGGGGRAVGGSGAVVLSYIPVGDLVIEKHLDLNGDGHIADVLTDPLLGGWSFTVTGPGMVGGVTDNDVGDTDPTPGIIKLINLVPGPYTVTEVIPPPPPTWICTYDTDGPILGTVLAQVVGGQTATVQFGNAILNPIPEPVGLGLMGLLLLATRKRRS